jgi:hypothetical protein
MRTRYIGYQTLLTISSPHKAAHQMLDDKLFELRSEHRSRPRFTHKHRCTPVRNYHRKPRIAELRGYICYFTKAVVLAVTTLSLLLIYSGPRLQTDGRITRCKLHRPPRFIKLHLRFSLNSHCKGTSLLFCYASRLARVSNVFFTSDSCLYYTGDDISMISLSLSLTLYLFIYLHISLSIYPSSSISLFDYLRGNYEKNFPLLVRQTHYEWRGYFNNRFHREHDCICENAFNVIAFDQLF